MATNTVVAKPPKGILRWFLRMPITLYRFGLGGLLGGRFVLINHIGRKTGVVRQTVVEVIAHNTQDDIYYVASGWGYKANWYRNLQATPDVAIQIGNRRLNVEAKSLSAHDGAQILLDYRQRHPRSAKQLGKVMGLNIDSAPEAELINIITESLPIIAFCPQPSP